jgi:hypothetical protein
MPAVISPLQEGLTLDRPAGEVAGVAVLVELREVAAHGLPPFDLAGVVFCAPAEVIAAVPLKPASGVLRMKPPLLFPVGERF